MRENKMNKLNINETLISYKHLNGVWKNSPFKQLKELTNDDKGEWGEDFIQKLVSYITKLSVKYIKSLKRSLFYKSTLREMVYACMESINLLYVAFTTMKQLK